jgi:glyoxylase-like metal-dependent hydrolase (beta-lactamase superfamily II)
MDARIEQVASTVNCWLVGDDEAVIIIDPGTDASAVLDAVGDREVVAVICTHGHDSHVRAALEVAKRDEAPVALHAAECYEWRQVHPDVMPEIEMADGGAFEVADVVLVVMHTPGHSPGSVCLYSEDLKSVFTGDTVVASGPYPHEGSFDDFPGQLAAIGEQVLDLPADTAVLCGHGERTTVAALATHWDSWVDGGPAPLIDEAGA